MTDLPGLPSRRSFLKASAAGAALSGFALSAKAQAPQPPVPLDQYEREYLNGVEWAFVLAAVSRLIPSEGDGPGAIEARVPVFIDRQLAGDYGAASDWYMEGPFQPDADPLRGWQTPLNPAQIYREAIPLVDQWCTDQHGAIFADLDDDVQDAVLTALQKNEAGLAPELKDFFTILLANTKEGYLSDPMYGGNHDMQAWVYVGFPGARANYKEWVDRFNVEYPLGPVSIKGERA
ncbi:gluconate 2-dehydrogenase subunit 3 family protein [Falsirhodobacter halotolerans]|uniref:gluconate 2-dehydrogenase subunit 3 family protein n=1 Tax=Falsirhodobacter halotolerans TaxID=1146892 RepID=UPI001FD617C2|nr:gluconate 2-dehydrogenase subunit 3 family protein [Falsirhodobacter halotolerans]MCJ8138991.1 gluconate 2-dehydrogenase subunit 3 family protein [Falsirhodobacter halotolerans]